MLTGRDSLDLRARRWTTRREALVRLLQKAEHGSRLSEHINDADGATVFKRACKLGLEGIVAKRRDRTYRSGRSIDWIKVKNPDSPAVTRLLEEEPSA
jgi:bifunctional non-homologous end joining protein LigD